MEEKCLKCHVTVRQTDYFCYNCGNNLKPVPPSVSLVDQMALYIKSILIPPFGILWAIKYLRQDSGKSKIVGIIAIVLTLTSLIICSILFKNFVSNVNKQVSEQLSSFGY
jgi:RsiW-degrading membrane proteinase PrsW (M82 family)